jgi:hypothetical protein
MLGIVSSVFDGFDADLAFATRPPVPTDMRSPGGIFRPAHELWDWMREVFIVEGSPLYNYEHEHLQNANLGIQWTNVPLERHGQTVAALTETATVQGNTWARARYQQQVLEWFGPLNIPFTITFCGPIVQQMSDAQFCALCEHELMHVGVKLDKDGEPAEDDEGNLKLKMRGHDVEEFVSIVERYGAGNSAGKTAELVRVAQLPPLVEAIDIRRCCGNCIK